MSEYNVAITVFATAPGVDADDAADVAELALRQALQPHSSVHVLAATVRQGREIPVRVTAVRETGRAAANGYLWVQSTGKAFRDRWEGGVPGE